MWKRRTRPSSSPSVCPHPANLHSFIIILILALHNLQFTVDKKRQAWKCQNSSTILTLLPPLILIWISHCPADAMDYNDIETFWSKSRRIKAAIEDQFVNLHMFPDESNVCSFKETIKKTGREFVGGALQCLLEPTTNRVLIITPIRIIITNTLAYHCFCITMTLCTHRVGWSYLKYRSVGKSLVL